MIKLETIEKVKKFISVIVNFANDIDIVSGRYVINAKSLLAIFSLDLTKELKLVIHDATEQDTERLEKVMEEFRVD
jgi:phosphotransferase system HPr-like phosphotransfer protein